MPSPVSRYALAAGAGPRGEEMGAGAVLFMFMLRLAWLHAGLDGDSSRETSTSHHEESALGPASQQRLSSAGPTAGAGTWKKQGMTVAAAPPTEDRRCSDWLLGCRVNILFN